MQNQNKLASPFSQQTPLATVTTGPLFPPARHNIAGGVYKEVCLWSPGHQDPQRIKALALQRQGQRLLPGGLLVRPQCGRGIRQGPLRGEADLLDTFKERI